MTSFEYFPLTSGRLLRFGDAARVAATLDAGGLAVLPTETGYALAADARNLDAVRQVFATKERSLTNPMHLAFGSLAMARRYAELDARAERLVGAFTPGPLTVVVPARDLPDTLVTLNGTVGIRVPDHPATLQVVSLLDRPVTATSLNRSGEESAPLDHAYLTSLSWPDGTVAVIEDKASITEPRASTLALIGADGIRILREGPVTRADIDAALTG